MRGVNSHGGSRWKEGEFPVESLELEFENYKSLIDDTNFKEISKFLIKLRNFKNKIIIFGNGGSANIANHIANDFGWDGLLSAIVARLSGYLALISSVFFAALRTGSSFLAATGVSRTITSVIQGLMVIAALMPAALIVVIYRSDSGKRIFKSEKKGESE